MQAQGHQPKRVRGMDRLPAVMFAGALALGGCDAADGTAKSSDVSRSRVDVVTAKGPKVDIAGFCDVHADAGTAKPMLFPALDGAKTPAPAAGWRWVNVWATWCKPCIEELPMLAKWRAKFASDHLPLEVMFLSVDAAGADVEAFRKTHPEAPEGPRIGDASGLGPWLQSIGLDEGSVLPIHLFVDGEQKIRCVRMGAVGERDYDTVRGLVQAG